MDRQAAASSQNEAEGSEATEEEATRERTREREFERFCFVFESLLRTTRVTKQTREWEDREVA